jgi:hypothetical protein
MKDSGSLLWVAALSMLASACGLEGPLPDSSSAVSMQQGLANPSAQAPAAPRVRTDKKLEAKAAGSAGPMAPPLPPASSAQLHSGEVHPYFDTPDSSDTITVRVHSARP